MSDRNPAKNNGLNWMEVYFLHKIHPEKSSPAVREDLWYHQGPVHLYLIVLYSLTCGICFRVPADFLSSSCPSAFPRKRRKGEQAPSLKALPVSRTEPFGLCHLGGISVTLPISVARRLGNSYGWLCAPGKIGSSITKEEAKNVFGGQLAGPLGSEFKSS